MRGIGRGWHACSTAHAHWHIAVCRRPVCDICLVQQPHSLAVAAMKATLAADGIYRSWLAARCRMHPPHAPGAACAWRQAPLAAHLNACLQHRQLLSDGLVAQVGAGVEGTALGDACTQQRQLRTLAQPGSLSLGACSCTSCQWRVRACLAWRTYNTPAQHHTCKVCRAEPDRSA
jgi:hypothetical protein